jgi:hypothetical protein
VHYRASVVGKRDLRVIEAVVKEKSVYSEKEIYIHRPLTQSAGSQQVDQGLSNNIRAP